MAIGINNENKTHSISYRHGRVTRSLHSEMHALQKFGAKFAGNAKYIISSCDMYNIRIDRNFQMKISKPCPSCQNLLNTTDIKNIYYTNNNGEFIKYV